MEWIICLAFSIIVLILGIFMSIIINKTKNKRRKMLSSFNVILGSVFLSAVIMFLPIYNDIFLGDSFKYIKTFLLSIHNTIRLFIVDGEFNIITDHITSDAGTVYSAYSVCAAFLFVLAPVLTFSIVLSFFKNISSYNRYLFGYYKNVYIFSELNVKSITLAENIKSNDSRRLIVFTDVFEQNEVTSYELLERAQEIGAICFKKDIQIVNFKIHSQKKEIYFFTISENESENIEQSIKLIELYRNIKKTNLYVFSSRVDCELLLTSINKGNMRVRRVNEVRALINRILYEEGTKIFDNSHLERDGIRYISAVIVGLGNHGKSMVKALSWYCQMDGYEVIINAFDRDKLAYDKLYVECPELLSEQYNGVSVDGEAKYKINIHSGIDVDTKAFADEISKLSKVTYVLVALGSDEENVRIAVYLRMLFERIGAKPLIQSIVFNSNTVKALEGVTNYRGQPYNIDFIGDMNTSYSENVIIDSELENDALSRHLKWGVEEEFWNYEYNYRSSIATALHMKARESCRIIGSGKSQEELTTDERNMLESLEHRRWNAYMRSEGYVFSGSCEKSSRNDLGKMHHNLVKYSLLTSEEKRKDSKVGTK